MSKFKIGDKVKVLKTIYESPFVQVGCIGTVVKVTTYAVIRADYLVVFSGDEFEFFFEESDLELVTDKLSKQYTPKVTTESEASIPLNKDKDGKPCVNALGGAKNDQGKVDYTYLLKDLPRACESVTKVLMYGAKKYDRLNWDKVETERYEAALLRHCVEYLKGNTFDDETKEHHLSHLVCCAMFIIERELRDEQN